MIALANDHIGIELKQTVINLLDEMKMPYKDFGAYSKARTDYPVFGYQAAKAVASGECEKGILICGTGVGISLSANKVKGIRCVVCSDCYTAIMSRMHNNCNMLAVGSRVLGPDLARMIVKMWLETSFEGERHQTRIDMITAIEKETFFPEV
jgi:ribose 5-phosphate isomerase B